MKNDLDTQVNARRQLQELMWGFYDDSDKKLTDQKFRMIVHAFSILLSWYKFDFESSIIIDHEERIRELEDRLNESDVRSA